MKSKVIVLIFGESLPWKCHFLAPQKLGPQKRHFQCRYEKSETTFIRQTFPKNEVYDLWFQFLSFLNAFFVLLRRKRVSNKKIQENKPVLKFNFTQE